MEADCYYIQHLLTYGVSFTDKNLIRFIVWIIIGLGIKLM